MGTRSSFFRCQSLILAIVIIVLSSCGGVKNHQTAKEPVRKIEVMASDGWIYDIAAENVKLFEKETGIKVDFTIYAAHVYSRALRTMLASGEVPDIFLTQTTRWYLGNELDPQKYCIDLTGEEWTKRLKPEWLPSVSYDGKIYGLVIWDDKVGWVYTYNNKIFERLGLSAPRNYQEFVKVCERLQRAGIVPIYEPGASRWHTSLTFFEMGGTYEAQNPELYWELNTNRLRFADYTPFHQALGQILSAVRQGFFGQDFMVNTVEGAKTALTNETAAMTLNKIGFARSVMKADPESGASSWGMFPIPWLNNNQVSIERSAPAWFGSATSHDKPAVLDLFRFLTRPDMLHRYALGQPEGTSLSFVGEPQPLLPNEDSFFQTARFVGEPFQGGVKYIMGQWMEIEADFETMLESGMSPQQFLERVDERRSNLAVSTGDPNWAKKASINPPL